MLKNIIIAVFVAAFVLLKTYGDFLEHKIENMENPAQSVIVSSEQLGTVRTADKKLNRSRDTIAGLCNSLSMDMPRRSKNSTQTAKNCQCVIDKLPTYLYAKRVEEFKNLYKLRYVTSIKMERTTNQRLKDNIFRDFNKKYEVMFRESGLSHREFGQGVLAVTKHVQNSCGFTAPLPGGA